MLDRTFETITLKVRGGDRGISIRRDMSMGILQRRDICGRQSYVRYSSFWGIHNCLD